MIVGGTGPRLTQTTGEAAFVSEAASKSATRSVEGPSTEVVRREEEIQQNATHPVEAPSAGPEVLLSSTSNAVQPVNEEDLQSEPGSPPGFETSAGPPPTEMLLG